MRWLARHRRQFSADQEDNANAADSSVANGTSASTSAVPGRAVSAAVPPPTTSASATVPGVTYGPPTIYANPNQLMAQFVLPNGTVVLRPAVPYAQPMQPQPDWEMQLALQQSAAEHAVQERIRQQRHQEVVQAQQRKQTQMQAQQLSQKWWKTTW